MSRILYQERKELWGENATGNTFVTDYVETKVRSWTSEGMCPDVVIHTRVLVDRALIVDERAVFSHADGDAAFIRMGIKEFDAMVAQYMPEEK